MKRPETWQEHVALAEHYLAIGQDEIYLSDTDDLPLTTFPWEFVTSIEKGSTFRHGVDVSKWFRAVHPCGLRFRWCLDLEVRDANGTGNSLGDTRESCLCHAEQALSRRDASAMTR